MNAKCFFAMVAALALTCGIAFADMGPKNHYYGTFYSDFFGAAILTVCIELAVACAYILYAEKRKPALKKNIIGILSAVVIGNIISLPIVWLVSGILSLACVFGMLFAEAMAVAIEAAVIFVLLDGRWAKKRVFSFEEALLLSILINAASYGAGLMLGRYYLF